jgi:hypothetical protein
MWPFLHFMKPPKTERVLTGSHMSNGKIGSPFVYMIFSNTDSSYFKFSRHECKVPHHSFFFLILILLKPGI